MIKDITPPTKNLNTDDLLKERVDITIDTTEKEIQDVSEKQNAIPEEGIEVAGGIKNILETITTTKTKDKTSQIKDIKGDKVPQDDLKDFSMDSLETAAEKKQKMEEILDDRNIPEGQLVKEQQGQVVMDIVDNVDYDALSSIMARFEDIPIEQLEGNVEDIFKRLDSGGPDQIDNLDDLIKFSFEDVIKQQGGNKTVTNDDLRKIADGLNLPDLYRKVLKRKEGDLLSNAEIYKGIEESLVMRKLYIKSIEDLKADPNNRELLEKANKYFRLYGLFLSKITGDVSETARKLRATSLANQTFGKIDTDELSTVLESIKVLNDADPADMLSYHKRFLALPLNKQSDMVQKGMFRKIVDGGIEVFVNSLLASPITHVVNFVSNMAFNSLRYTENFIASGLNKIPGYKDPDGVMFSEAMELFYNFKDANKVAGEYFIDSVKRGGVAPESKLDLGSHRAVSTDVLHPSWKDPNNKLKYAMGKTLNAYGHIARLPGTFLVASDEMTKGALYVIAQKQLARRRYNEVINTGGTDEQAQAAAYKVMTDPTVADQNIIKQEGLTGTFQGDLPEGFLKDFQQTLNHPGFKVFVPFYKTVTNIFLEQAKRNPVTGTAKVASSAMLMTGVATAMNAVRSNGKSLEKEPDEILKESIARWGGLGFVDYLDRIDKNYEIGGGAFGSVVKGLTGPVVGDVFDALAYRKGPGEVIATNVPFYSALDAASNVGEKITGEDLDLKKAVKSAGREIDYNTSVNLGLREPRKELSLEALSTS